MSAFNDETELFERIGTKKQKNLTLSREVVGVLADVVDDGRESAFVERAIWSLMVNEYGEADVVEAIEEVQQELDDREKLARSKPYTLPA